MKQGTSGLTNLLPVVVFSLFALCLMGVLLCGAGVYQRLNEPVSPQYTAARYLSTRLRQGDEICVGEFGGCQTLEFLQEIDGEPYLTRIYCHEGYLRELFSPVSAALEPEDGEALLDLSRLCLTLDEGLLKVEAEDQTLYFALRSGKQVGP